MNNDEYINKLTKNVNNAINIIIKKSSDYAKSDNPFSTFEMAKLLGMNVENGIVLRMGDKLSRIANLLKKDKIMVKDESIEDTLIDLMNYANILLVYLQNKKNL